MRMDQRRRTSITSPRRLLMLAELIAHENSDEDACASPGAISSRFDGRLTMSPSLRE